MNINVRIGPAEVNPAALEQGTKTELDEPPSDDASATNIKFPP